MIIIYIIGIILCLLVSIFFIYLANHIDHMKLKTRFEIEKFDEYDHKIYEIQNILDENSRTIVILERVCQKILSVYK